MIRLGHTKNVLLGKVNRKSGADVLECYQCGKCVGSCPVTCRMTITPRQMMQYIKLGMEDEVYKANTSWFCLGCSTCSARCPREIDIPKVMEAVRHLALHEKVNCPDPEAKVIRKFHEIFLQMIQSYGRLFELRFMAEFNIRTLNFFKDISLAPQVLGKGKLAFTPSSIQNSEVMEKLFAASEKMERHLAEEEVQ